MRYALAAFYVNGNNPMLKVISPSTMPGEFAITIGQFFLFIQLPVTVYPTTRQCPQQHALCVKHHASPYDV
jgi:hypothetical protein